MMIITITRCDGGQWNLLEPVLKKSLALVIVQEWIQALLPLLLFQHSCLIDLLNSFLLYYCQVVV